MRPLAPVSVLAGTVVSWANAWLVGLVSLDEAARRASGGDAPHRVHGVPEEIAPVSWSVALGRLRASGVERFQLALPEPGDPLGLSGPPTFNNAATAAGAAVLAVCPGTTYGLLPGVDAGEVRWHVLPVHPAPFLDSVPEAERGFRRVLRAATAAMESLDVAGGRTAAPATSEPAPLSPSPVLSGPAMALIGSATRLAAAVAAARAQDGAATSAGQARLRQEALRPVSAAARRALVAAYSSTGSEQTRR